MRTIKRCSDELNKTKIKTFQEIALAFKKEKQHWLSIFQQYHYMVYIKRHRFVRDEFVASRYRSKEGLQARMWKLALIEAAETMDKYWQSIFDKVKRSIHRNKGLDELQRHYCFWLLKDYQRLPFILQGDAIQFKELDDKKSKQALHFLKRTIKKNRKAYPVVKLGHSFALDDNCYGCFEHNGNQYIKIMSLKKGQRIALPLKGRTPIQGNIRIILKNNVAYLHHAVSVKSASFRNDNNEVVGIDFGYTEVITDSEGNRYGEGFGKNLTEISDWLKEKILNRNKLHALQKNIRYRTIYQNKRKQETYKKSISAKRN